MSDSNGSSSHASGQGIRWMPSHSLRLVTSIPPGGATAEQPAIAILRCTRCGMTKAEIDAYGVTLCPCESGNITMRADMAVRGLSYETVHFRG